MTNWIRTEELLDRLPYPRREAAPFVMGTFLGRKELPHEISLERAIALTASAQARARGVAKPRRVYDLVLNPPSKINGMLVVVKRGGTVQLVRAEGFKPTSAVVIDLDEIVELVESGSDIPA